MSEWGVVGVIIALAGFVALIVKPMIALNTSIVKLTVKMERLGDGITELKGQNELEHDRIRSHEEKQDEQLADHERRIVRAEGRRTAE